VPRDLEAIVMSALAKSPKARPQSAKELSALLSPFATKGHTSDALLLSERPMLLKLKKKMPKKRLELVLQSSVPPRRAPHAPLKTEPMPVPQKTVSMTIKPTKKS
jgi:hypothetical protein